MSRTIIVEDNDVEKALKRFKRIANETKRDTRRHEYYLRPGLRLKEKQKLARKHRKNI
ncbi:MAG: 30S ribosomal protein S21 [Ureaplasma sp.]|nr:30S ribosomal protein S21 [Ureaplasma sp.]MDE5651654.1 30S ribosomal protein S21 [Ureaplasma sp.]MDE7221694.1 30S ribosomal protein S21 [Ureaplasma sp.]